ncbi:hypothetical protein MTBBW1_1260003 [Desulfamplus magnetovallimortis]|uniref:Uncharacterized protein n=1 Tax=Desulfamplus magnetovallimortis TaxID=1246637 RepID=A0A1W1H6G9_9BACT|nr:hypothetical protein MTBBW1_1260003 [Desulfamplus magnetovallimortis]
MHGKEIQWEEVEQKSFGASGGIFQMPRKAVRWLVNFTTEVSKYIGFHYSLD